MIETFKAVENTVGKPETQNRIIFASMEVMKKARQAVEDGRDILVEVDDVVLLHKNHEIGPLLYDGKLVFGARTESAQKEKAKQEIDKHRRE